MIYGNRNLGRSACTLAIAGAMLVLGGCAPVIDYHTQLFGAGEATCLDGKQLYFARSGYYDTYPQHGSREWLASGYYDRLVVEQSGLPVDTTGHDPVDFSEADPFPVSLPSGVTIPYYGRPAHQLTIKSDGTVGLGSSTPQGNESLTQHFNLRQISLLPVDATVAGARVTYSLTQESAVITFQNVHGNTVQCQLFFRGDQESDIAITYASVSTNTLTGAVGLSNDQGSPPGVSYIREFDFVAESFVASNLCEDSVPRIWLQPPATQ